MKTPWVLCYLLVATSGQGCGGSLEPAAPFGTGDGHDTGDVAEHFDATASDSDASAPDSDGGGFFLIGTVAVAGGSGDPTQVTFAVHDDLGQAVPVRVLLPGPDYRLEVPVLPDFERNYRVTFALDGYHPLVSLGVFKPGFSGSLDSDTAGVSPATFHRGLPVGLGGGTAISPTDGTMLVRGPERYRIVRRGPAGITVTELPDTETGVSLGGSCVTGQGSPVAFTPDGRLAFVPSATGVAVVDLANARVAAVLPNSGRARSVRGTMNERDHGMLLPSVGGDFAIFPLEPVGANAERVLFLTWAGGVLEQTPLPVAADGFTRDGAWFVSLEYQTNVRAYERATGQLVPFGTTDYGGPPQLGVDASFMLIADRPEGHPPGPAVGCWYGSYMDSCTLRVVMRASPDTSTTLATDTLRYAVSSTRRAVIYAKVDAVVHHDLDSGQITTYPLTVAFPGNLQYTALSSLVTDDRFTVYDDLGATVFDIATGAIVTTIPGVWGALMPVAGDTVALTGRCRAQDGATDCRRALIDTRSGQVTMLPASQGDGFYASGARQFAYPTSWAGLPIVEVGDPADPNQRWDELAAGSGTQGACGFEWPASHHAPCLLYIRPERGLLQVDGVTFDTLCFE